jgi:hypothetical protein
VKDLAEMNRLVAVSLANETNVVELSGETLFKAAFLMKALGESKVSKTITFHSLRARAVAFSKILEVLSKEGPNRRVKSLYISYVLGNQSSAERSEIIEQFEKSKVAILSNVQVLSEGVNIPIIDSVYFVDPKNSVIDIVQAVGRALRKPYGKDKPKVARIIVPMIIPPEVKSLDQVEWDETLETFHYVIQAMRAQDQRLDEEINQINLYETTGGTKGRRIGSGGRIAISVGPGLELRQKISIASFLDRINIRVATVNANPTGAKEGYSHLGKGERKIEYSPIFDILGDYNPEVFLAQLVTPTLSRFKKMDQRIERKLLKVNHNNVSHTERLGLIASASDGRMQLTKLGRMFWRREITFDNLFKNQIMLYSISRGLFPYRVILQMLIELGSLNHIEFIYGPYIIQPTAEGKFDTVEPIDRVRYLRERFPRIDLTNVANRNDIRNQLNELSPFDIPDKDVWGDRSTPKNKFRYMKNAMALFGFIQGGENSFRTPIILLSEGKERAKQVLRLSSLSSAPSADYYESWYWLSNEGGA